MLGRYPSSFTASWIRRRVSSDAQQFGRPLMTLLTVGQLTPAFSATSASVARALPAAAADSPVVLGIWSVFMRPVFHLLHLGAGPQWCSSWGVDAYLDTRRGPLDGQDSTIVELTQQPFSITVMALERRGAGTGAGGAALGRGAFAWQVFEQ